MYILLACLAHSEDQNLQSTSYGPSVKRIDTKSLLLNLFVISQYNNIKETSISTGQIFKAQIATSICKVNDTQGRYSLGREKSSD